MSRPVLPETQTGATNDLADRVRKLERRPGSSLNSALANDTVSGLTTRAVAGEALSFGNCCYMKSDGTLAKADADPATPLAPVVAMAAADIGSGESGRFLLHGLVRNDGSYAWTVGGMLYLSGTAGAMTHTAPSGADDVVQVLGVAWSADIAFFAPQLVLVVHT